jgi:hypothetical protein
MVMAAPKMAKKAEYSPAMDIKRIIPLNRGQHAYLCNPLTGKTHQHKTNSDEFIAEMVSYGEAWAPRLGAQLAALADGDDNSPWAGVRVRFADALAEAAANSDEDDTEDSDGK